MLEKQRNILASGQAIGASQNGPKIITKKVILDRRMADYSHAFDSRRPIFGLYALPHLAICCSWLFIAVGHLLQLA